MVNLVKGEPRDARLELTARSVWHWHWHLTPNSHRPSCRAKHWRLSDLSVQCPRQTRDVATRFSPPVNLVHTTTGQLQRNPINPTKRFCLTKANANRVVFGVSLEELRNNNSSRVGGKEGQRKLSPSVLPSGGDGSLDGWCSGLVVTGFHRGAVDDVHDVGEEEM